MKKYKKEWIISGSSKIGWSIFWGYEGKSPRMSYLIPRSWKTIKGATRYGLNLFGSESKNN